MQTTTQLSAVLRERIRHRAPLTKLLRGTVTFEPAGHAPFSLVLHHQDMRVVAGRVRRPDTTVIADPATLAEVIAGTHSGVDAFLAGRLRVRGNLALGLKLDSLFTFPLRPVHVTRANFVDAGGVRTFFLEAGEGEPVVLLHGLGATNASMLPTLAALSRRYRVIAPDNPGFGESDKPRVAYHAAFYAQWLTTFLDVLEIPRAHFIGNSMGGRIALEMGIRHPGRTAKLVLLAPSMAWMRFRQFAPLVRLLMPELAFMPLLLPRRRVMQGLKLMFAKPERLQPGWYEAAVDEFQRVFRSPRGRIAFFSAARQIYLEESHGDNGFWQRLPSIESPALFFWGTHDRLVPARFAHHATRALPHAQSIVLAECGHVPQFELPDETHRLILDFLA